jgi:hypothetical protein
MKSLLGHMGENVVSGPLAVIPFHGAGKYKVEHKGNRGIVAKLRDYMRTDLGWRDFPHWLWYPNNVSKEKMNFLAIWIDGKKVPDPDRSFYELYMDTIVANGNYKDKDSAYKKATRFKRAEALLIALKLFDFRKNG